MAGLHGAGRGRGNGLLAREGAVAAGLCRLIRQAGVGRERRDDRQPSGAWGRRSMAKGLEVALLVAQVGAAELDGFAAQGTHGAKHAAKGFLGAPVPAEHGGGIVHGNEVGKAGAPFPVRGLGGMAGGGLGLGEQIAAEAPDGEFAGAPFVKVLLGDGAAGEFAGKEGLHAGLAVQPR